MFKGLATYLIFLLMPTMITAQENIEPLIGDKIEYQEPIAVQMYLDHFNNPWDDIDESGKFFYFGEMIFDYCNDVNVVRLTITSSAKRECIDGVCGHYSVYDVGPFVYTLQWQEQTKSYLSLNSVYYGFSVVTIIVNEGTTGLNIMKIGTMNYNEDNMLVWDHDRPWYFYIIEPLSAPKLVPPPRRATERIPRER